ncbi:MAG TPA: DUF5667 domain-containing protein [Candidatus Paceibacterota bacterium]|nr:DUF5667 domain-containing protein [Candidatus Paceibacterota bacterium]
MDHFEKLIREAGSRETLTEAERARMRSMLQEYAAMKPVREGVAAERARPVSGWFVVIRQPLYAALAVVFTLSASLGGVAYAAEGTLPGDPLYGVKVSVTEPLRVALAGNAKEEAALEMSFAERRLAEAATLANEGRLSPEAEASLTVNFNAHTEAATEAVAQADSATDAEITTASFADRLVAYTNVLAVAKKPSDATTTSALQVAINDQVSALQPRHAATMMAFAAPKAFAPAATSTRAPERASDLSALAQATDDALHATAGVIKDASSTLDASTSASVREEFDHASSLAAHAHALLDANDEEGARAAFHDSLSASSRLDVLTRAAADLKINVFASSTRAHGEDATSSPATPSHPLRIRGTLPGDDASETDDGSGRRFPFGF